MINEFIYAKFEKTFSLFLMRCVQSEIVSHHKTNTFKDLRRLMRSICKGPVNPLLYKRFGVSNQTYFSSSAWSLTLSNRNNDSLYLDDSNYPYFKHWVNNIKTAPTLNIWKWL